MEDTRSDLWVRERATIKDNPALASHAERVSKMRFFDKISFFESLKESITNPIKRDISKSSKHRRIDKRWSRFRRIPNIPR